MFTKGVESRHQSKLALNARHLLVFFAIGVAVAAVVGLVMTTYWQRHQPALTMDAPRLISALRAFSSNLSSKGQPLPATVTLHELVSGGFLSTGDVGAFEGTEVMIWLSALDNNPESILMSARLPDGTVNALLTDGSVQQISSERFQAQLQKCGRKGAAPPNERH